jgi:hypothetical protein
MIHFGFEFGEKLRGSYHLLAAPLDDRDIGIDLTISVDSIPHLVRSMSTRLRGTINAHGLATKATTEGTLTIRLRGERRLAYELRFAGDQGEPLLLSGEKDVFVIGFLDSITTLPASLYDAAGQEIGRATLKFDVAGEFVAFVRSIKVSV